MQISKELHHFKHDYSLSPTTICFLKLEWRSGCKIKKKESTIKREEMSKTICNTTRQTWIDCYDFQNWQEKKNFSFTFGCIILRPLKKGAFESVIP